MGGRLRKGPAPRFGAKVLAAVAAISALAPNLASGGTLPELAAYPEYPPQIERDYAYSVCVTQGAERKSLVVYNHCEKSPQTKRTRGGDVNRRFCEFAFSGAPVRVDISVCEDVKSYKVFPSSLRLETAFSNGVISVWLDKPHSFGIELNDYVKSILSVLVDEPEDPADEPSRDAPGVLYVDGWMDPPGPDGVVLVSNNWSEVYIAPGAVLNARLYVQSPNVRVHGRGMILDPFSDIFRFDQLDNAQYGVLWVNGKGKGALIEDIKIIDARTFNYWMFADDVTMRNVKALSSMMCSDGITSGGRNFTVDGAWLYVGDNALVVSGNKAGCSYRDVTIGTSCKAIFPQGSNYGVTMEDINVFRADEALIWNSYNQSTNQQDQSFFFKNISAVDCTLFARFFGGGNMGAKPKTFGFENVAIPNSTGTDDWTSIGRSGGKTIRIYDDAGKPWVTGNYTMAITNLWVNGQRAEGFSASEISGPEGIAITVSNALAESAIPAVPNRHIVNWTCPWKRYVGDSIQRDVRLATPATGPVSLAEPDIRANLLVDRAATRSSWQRSPSYQAKLDATTFDKDDGARIYRVRSSVANAGMYHDATDGFLRRGNGTWRISFDARIAVTNDTPPVIQAKIIANEKTRILPFPLANGGNWTRCSADIVTDFDLGEETVRVGLNRVTELLGIQMVSTNVAQEMDFKNLSFAKVAGANGAPLPPSVSDVAGFEHTNRIVTVVGLVAGSQVGLSLSAPDGEPFAILHATADADGVATFAVPTEAGRAYSYSVSQNGALLGGGTFLAGAWDADGSWFQVRPDGVGGAVERNGSWTIPPLEAHSDRFVLGREAEFGISGGAVAAGSNGIVRAEVDLPCTWLRCGFGDLDNIPRENLDNSLAAVVAMKPEGDGDNFWAACVGGEWTIMHGAEPPVIGRNYRIRMEGDFALDAPRVRLSVCADGGETFATLIAPDGSEWLTPNDGSRRALSAVATHGEGELFAIRGSLSNTHVAEVGGIGYDSLAEALRASAPGDAIALLADATAPKSLMRGREDDILRNGHALRTHDDTKCTVFFIN